MLTDKIHLPDDLEPTPEDIMSSSLSVIFPDDIQNQHGDSHTSPTYLSPLYGPLTLSLADPKTETSRTLFSHFLWNASVLLAEYLEEGPFPLFETRDCSVLELGAGTGLSGMIAALRGARRTVITDYPAEEVVANVEVNVKTNLRERGRGGDVEVWGHEWGVLGEVEDNGVSKRYKGGFERVLVADCLWMPWQHSNLRKSIAWFLTPSPKSNSSTSPPKRDETSSIPPHHHPPSPTHPYTPSDGGRAYVIAGFHTGRAKMAPFFDAEAMRGDGLVVERIWERNAEGTEREWRVDRGEEDKDVTGRKRWLVVGVVRRVGEGE
ncbi:hypothetical protein GLAREA_05501 [Glarea lozoyensis ATCC 20868]|uniref:S-adenosyl-L-methionine-dependent methyltransferase n=1 Tax=Glarea lozoyensis (strain ATCC 20868 / MF5171) TaxID=1116229 RepID=S3ECZ7_GLAL2|nr:uncharacterized protein GLAREA_05501 [Glarea lozoyensis ATCC 20868]EPE36163.1 hypothetical protein GLAREA_05501 [Glarea lozoyensis ATCC 20868]